MAFALSDFPLYFEFYFTIFFVFLQKCNFCKLILSRSMFIIIHEIVHFIGVHYSFAVQYSLFILIFISFSTTFNDYFRQGIWYCRQAIPPVRCFAVTVQAETF